jgi:hypothetical protein
MLKDKDHILEFAIKLTLNVVKHLNQPGAGGSPL